MASSVGAMILPLPLSEPNITHVPECCACGTDGLGLIRSTDGQQALGEVTLDHRHGGYSNTAHGGIVATFLDDVLGTVPQLYGFLAVTGTLEIKYRKPGILGRRYTLVARLVGAEGRRMMITGEMLGEDGVIAEAAGTWVRVDESHYVAAQLPTKH